MNKQLTTGHPAVLHLPVRILQAKEGAGQDSDDQVAVEEPLEIRLEYGPPDARREQAISITMRTPGSTKEEQDLELAVGFLYSEGILSSASDILSANSGMLAPNTVRVALESSVSPDLDRLHRHFYTSSSCGICGKSSIEALKNVCPPSKMQERDPSQTSVPGRASTSVGSPIPAEVLFALPAKLRREQAVFQSTGGLHASALFDRDGNLVGLREDIGRHNALDKLIGWALLEDRVPLSSHILLLSGRACFELIQKAAMAGIRVVVAIGPPSSLAVQLARDCGITLAGFLREQRVNLYTGAHRIADPRI